MSESSQQSEESTQDKSAKFSVDTVDAGDVSGDQQASVPLDQAFEVLKNRRRRQTLQYLRAHDGETTLSDVAEHIAALENDTTVQAISSTQRKRVYVALYQCHLPKMDDIGVVEFDKNRGTIVATPAAAQLNSYFESSQRREWYKVYLAVALAGSVLFVLSLGGGSEVGLTPSVVLLVLLIGVAASCVAQALEDDD